ncbi:MAG: hypothetical protein AMXMBFR19_22150 [Chthonomonadaceae bacterium]|uniref:Uncharacterized protein n=1 Tax=Candidatus Nitrosymbiomonas proteolyticus TaxID=2608984 RepID=A0A809RDF9_9BACT|nr:conserved hypothetical protein [Candidatus Nitrosymbiomonas proteolyticus]
MRTGYFRSAFDPTAKLTSRSGNRLTRNLDGNPITWSYDDLYRLTGQAKAGQVCTYTLDGVGNLKTMWEGGNFPRTFTFNAADRLVTMVEGSSLTTYAWTGYGALESEITGSQTTGYAYNGQDQLAVVTDPSGDKTTYSFDGDGFRRSVATTNQNQDPPTLDVTTMVWDGSDYLLLNEPTQNRVVLTLEGEIVSCGSKDLLTDPLGSLVKEISAGASLGGLVQLTPYGTLLPTSEQVSIPFVYIAAYGYYNDTADRDYVRARELYKKLGRWMQTDPIWPIELPISYAAGRPLMEVDPTGLFTTQPIDCKGCGRTLLILPDKDDKTGIVVGPPVKGKPGQTGLMTGADCLRFAQTWAKGRNCVCVNGSFFYGINPIAPLDPCNGPPVKGIGGEPNPLPIVTGGGYITGSIRPIEDVPSAGSGRTGRTGACVDKNGKLVGIIVTTGCSASDFAKCAGKHCPKGSRFVWLDGSGSSQVWGSTSDGPKPILGGNTTKTGKPDWRPVDNWIIICD